MNGRQYPLYTAEASTQFANLINTASSRNSGTNFLARGRRGGLECDRILLVLECRFHRNVLSAGSTVLSCLLDPPFCLVCWIYRTVLSVGSTVVLSVGSTVLSCLLVPPYCFCLLVQPLCLVCWIHRNVFSVSSTVLSCLLVPPFCLVCWFHRTVFVC